MMNKDICKVRCEEIQELTLQYTGKYQNLRREFDENVVFEKFATGGVDMHRGYYEPSLIHDIYCNVNRGRLCKEDYTGKVNYRYGFDANGRLIKVQSTTPSGYEFIIYSEGKDIGVQYMKNQKVRRITECQYYPNGQLKTYEFFDLEPDKGKVSFYRREGYEYKKDGMIVECTDYVEHQSKQIMIHDILHFKVEDGCLKEYTNKSYVDGVLKDTPANDWVWKVDIKRRVS